MFTKLTPINKENHANLKVKAIESFEFASKFHIASVMVHEFVRAASVYPIVFLEDKAQDEFRPVTLLSLDAGENLFVDVNGKWQASYVPAIIRRYPFALAKNPEQDSFTVCVDEDSAYVGTEEGQPLFDENGEPTAVIENVKRYLGELQQMEAFTKAFCHFLSENNLFTPLNMRVRAADQIKNVTGCYVINEERLNNLSDKKFLEIKEKRYLAPIYSHLTSLSQIERLALLKQGVSAIESPAAATEGNLQ
ncbi:SapC family protein [Maribrevibacterium harenarium]|uniref:SapC family protein n=1 Tax=Maribrevibacterium harenarium TaxID=2589817 RepID=A0A501WBI3_9GAMM|nr:SapC family protein [Maribrevibacterium harenarium]TPE46979.1 SapC family protein [Maribrevibacterium harenarium]